jgi:hypothetical protein
MISGREASTLLSNCIDLDSRPFLHPAYSTIMYTRGHGEGSRTFNTFLSPFRPVSDTRIDLDARRFGTFAHEPALPEASVAVKK